MPDNYAILLGVSNYHGISELSGPQTDVERMESWLLNPQGGNVPAKNLKRFNSDKSLSSPLQHQIDQWIGEVYQQLSQAGVIGGRLYFYFSGHGLGIDFDETAMLLPPWNSFLRSAALSSDKYLKKLRGDGMFEQVYFFLDCCNNRLPGTGGLPPTFGKPMLSATPATHLVLFASEFDAPAYEAAQLDPDKPDNSLTRGLFTEVLLQGLNGAAAGSNGRIKVTDLIAYIEEELPAYALTKKKRQIPRPVNTLAMSTLITNAVFPKTIEISIEFKTPGQTVILEDADAEEVETIDTSVALWKKELPRGKYWLRKPDETNVVMKIVNNGLQTTFTYD